MRWLGRQLSRIGYVRAAITDRADLSRFSRRPQRRLLVGLVLVFLGLLIGWPAVSLLGVAALAWGEPALVTKAAPAVYALSWVVYGLGFVVGGVEALRYARDFNRWLVRVAVEWMRGGPERAEDDVPSTEPVE